MGVRLKQKHEPILYDRDFYRWAIETAHGLRSGEISPVDRNLVAQELDDMARRDERELKSRARKVIHHLLKWAAQPWYQSSSWRSALVRDRAEIEDLIEQSPSLEYKLRDNLGRVYDRALTMAIGETGLDPNAFPRECPFTVEEILDSSFFPKPFQPVSKPAPDIEATPEVHTPK